MLLQEYPKIVGNCAADSWAVRNIRRGKSKKKKKEKKKRVKVKIETAYFFDGD